MIQNFEAWLQLVTMILAQYAIIYSFRRESRDDMKHFDNRWYASIKAIELEMKDFHDRLIEIEKRKKLYFMIFFDRENHLSLTSHT